MRLGIIGCGNMGSALAKGILSKKILPFNSIYISDKESQKVKDLNRKFGIRVSTNEEVVKKCNVIVLSVKPQDSRVLLSSIARELDQAKHLISVMAGLTISKIESLTDRKLAITRAMPNMAALAGRSITCLCHNRNVKDKATINKLFSSIGEVLEIEEKDMDAVTALSGSGPAYFFYLAEALRDAGIKLGMKKENAAKIAVSVLAGSGALLDSLKIDPEVLRERVTSKKGTTEEALRVFAENNFREIIEHAVKAAAKRAKELSDGI